MPHYLFYIAKRMVITVLGWRAAYRGEVGESAGKGHYGVQRLCDWLESEVAEAETWLRILERYQLWRQIAYLLA
jgi:hypothetical protein